MNNQLIAGKTIKQWKKDYPLLEKISSTEEVFWKNPSYLSFDDAVHHISLTEADVKKAEERLQRFASYIAEAFPETRELNGIIESPTVEIREMNRCLEEMFQQKVDGKLLLKCDNQLSVSGSIKARGGIYEVLKHAEDLAIEHGMITMDDDYSIINSQKFRDFFSHYSIVVGSTGNLGLSIGIIGAKLGFNVTVHMSVDAKQWKKDLLRKKGVTVVEHTSDYGKAVEEGRKQSDLDANSYFVDDENSINLFLGYAVAATRLKKQLDEMNVVVDQDHPLFVYLPCGVGGGPGGVAFGLKMIFKDDVHCFFAEPTHSPSMMIGLMTGKHDKISVQDFGIDNITDADGLAVGRASGFVGKTLENLISGSYTVDDQTLYVLLTSLIDTENIRLEPSALAGVHGPVQLFKEEEGRNYLKDKNLTQKMANATHIAWGTGGSMVPNEVMEAYYQQGLAIKNKD
ncbi:D-serine ammonia-lyase [Oceanobacillus saliphilus]|uniref:D-serine ammonia-lyase n=1 Tax=Oceanobacillus saliphilus TaxID=2925834 RepID=UPI00201DDC85|nr:D-serine ammonia-lyase [Oceanobacillus saliphilus]